MIRFGELSEDERQLLPLGTRLHPFDGMPGLTLGDWGVWRDEKGVIHVPSPHQRLDGPPIEEQLQDLGRHLQGLDDAVRDAGVWSAALHTRKLREERDRLAVELDHARKERDEARAALDGARKLINAVPMKWERTTQDQLVLCWADRLVGITVRLRAGLFVFYDGDARPAADYTEALAIVRAIYPRAPDLPEGGLESPYGDDPPRDNFPDSPQEKAP